jgi:tetratricopeptide (TPR) repeat protein
MARSRESLWLWTGTFFTTVGAALAGVAGALDSTRAHFAFWSSTPMVVAYVAIGLAFVFFAGAIRDLPFPFTFSRTEEVHGPAVSTGERSQSVTGTTGIVIGGDVIGSTIRFSTHHATEKVSHPVSLRPAASGPVVVGDVPQQPPAYQARDALLRLLPESGGGPGICVVHAVTGMPGIGKTQLAADYARGRIRDKWRLVAWVNAESTGTALDGLTQAARSLGIQLSDNQADTARAVRHWLEVNGEHCLIVFDNASDPDTLRPYLPAAGDAQIIITSTNQAVTGLGTSVPLDVFTKDEALAYLSERTAISDADGAWELAVELDRLPLALAQATAVIRAQRLTYPAYLKRLRTLPVEQYLARSTEDPYPRAAAAAILLSLQAIESGDPTGLAAQLMDLIAVLSPAGTPRDLLQTAATSAILTERRSPPRIRWKRSSAVHESVRPADIDAVLAHIAGASLLTFSLDNSTVSAHRLTMRVIRGRCLRNGTLLHTGVVATTVLSEAIQSLGSVWQHQAAARDLTQQVTALHDHLAPVIATTDKLGLELAKLLIAVRAWALWCVLELGDNAMQAVKIGEALTADAERLLGPTEWETLVVRGNLAIAYQEAGRLTDALPLHERSLADREGVLGPDHPATISARNNLAHFYSETGYNDKAIALFEYILADRERALGPDDPETLLLRHNLAATYQDALQVDKAIPLLERNVADRERVLGPNDRHTLQSRNNLALAYQQVGRMAEAVPLHRHTLADRERLLGLDHPETLESRENLALAYQHSGRLEMAIPMLERSLADRERLLGADHPLTLTCQANLVAAYVQAEQTDKAIPLAERTVAARERVLGADHPDALTSRGHLAVAYLNDGKPDKAIPLAEQTARDCERILGLDHPETLAVRGTLAIAYLMKGRTADAIPLLERSLADFDRVFGPDHPETRALQDLMTTARNPRGKQKQSRARRGRRR